MNENKKSKNKWLILLLLLLISFASITTLIYLDRLMNYLPNDEGSLPIVDEDNTNDTVGSDTVIEPGFVIYDNNGIWHMESSVEIFKIAYENGEKEISVVSDNGDKVIAPGSNNSYTFKLKNTGNVAMDYDLSVKTTVSNNLEIPMEGKINRFDGKWIYGNKENYKELKGSNMIEDSFTLGSGRYSSYTIDWQWPFEGDDEWDTYLGNLTVNEPIIYTIEISTVATLSKDTDSIGGILATPNTGDNNQVLLYSIIGGIALIFMLVLFIHKKDEDEKDEK